MLLRMGLFVFLFLLRCGTYTRHMKPCMPVVMGFGFGGLLCLFFLLLFVFSCSCFWGRISTHRFVPGVKRYLLTRGTQRGTLLSQFGAKISVVDITRFDCETLRFGSSVGLDSQSRVLQFFSAGRVFVRIGVGGPHLGSANVKSVTSVKTV